MFECAVATITSCCCFAKPGRSERSARALSRSLPSDRLRRCPRRKPDLLSGGWSVCLHVCHILLFRLFEHISCFLHYTFIWFQGQCRTASTSCRPARLQRCSCSCCLMLLMLMPAEQSASSFLPACCKNGDTPRYRSVDVCGCGAS